MSTACRSVCGSDYNGMRLHAGIGYVTPNDEHEGRGPAIRKAPPGPDSSRLAPSGVHGTASTGTLNHPRSPAMSADRSAIYRELRDRSGLDPRSLV